MYKVLVAHNKLQKISTKIGKKKISWATLVRYLNKEFKSQSVKFRSEQSEDPSIEGFYNPLYYTEDNELRYSIIIRYEKHMPKTRPRTDFYIDLLSALTHEFRHGYQDNKRNKMVYLKKLFSPGVPHFHHRYKSVVMKVQYYGDYDELDAYAFEAAQAIKLQGLNLRNVGNKSWVLSRYRKILGKYAPKLYNRFLKKLYLFLHK